MGQDGVLKLFAFQEQDAERIAGEMGGRVLLASDMGLGKTVVTIAVIARLKALPVVIICPSGLRVNWLEEALRWSKLRREVAASKIHVVRKGTDPIVGPVCIISYKLAVKRVKELRALAPKMLVLDEAHAIKSLQSNVAKALVPLCARTPYCLLLSGTPLLNKPIELYPLLRALKAPWIKDVVNFGKTYCGGYREEVTRRWDKKQGKLVPKYAWNFEGASNLDDLSARLAPHMIRRRKSEVLADLPPKLRVRMMVEPEVSLTHDEEALRRHCRGALALADGDVAGALEILKAGGEVEDEALAAYRSLGRSKQNAVAEWLVDNVDAENPVVVFAHHLDVLEFLAVRVRGAGLRASSIVGATSVDERQAAVKGFQSGEIDVLLCGITAANAGFTLTRAREMIAVELPWNPQIAKQMEGRIHRIGQTRGTTCRYVIAVGTFDETLWAMLRRKDRVAHKVVEGGAGDAERFEAHGDERLDVDGELKAGRDDEHWALVAAVLLEESGKPRT